MLADSAVEKRVRVFSLARAVVGGGGAGMGGAIFVQQGGTLTIAGTFSVNGNTVNGGTGGGRGGLDGHAFGSGIFMQGSGTISFAPGSGQAQVISNVIADEKGVVARGYKAPTVFTPGSWGLTLNGPGSLTLSAANMYIGGTNVMAGTLNVTGSIADSNLTSVSGGGDLIGTGTVGVVKINSGGVFAPGASGAPGTNMTASGNLAFASGAVYLVQLDPSTSTKANVSGAATLTGATAEAQFASGSYLTKQYQILQTTGGLGGTTFANLSNVGLPSGFTDSLSYSGTDVFLDLVPTRPLNGFTTNERNVANALNNYFNSGGTLPANFVPVFGLTGGALASALMQLDGEVATGSEVPAFQLMDEFLNLMLDPFVDGRLGNGAYGSDAAMGFAPDAQTILPPDVALAYAGVLKAPPGRKLRGRQCDGRRSGRSRFEQSDRANLRVCRWYGLPLFAGHNRRLCAWRRRDGLGPCRWHGDGKERCVPVRCLWHHPRRPGLSRRLFGVCQSLDDHKPRRHGRHSDRKLRGAELRWAR